MENNNYEVGTKVIMKNQHPCGANEWEITRIGADIKIPHSQDKIYDILVL